MTSLLLGLALAADPLTHAELHTLDNGLRVLIERDARTDEVVVGVRYDVGSHDEVDGEHGCAHLFEHLMFEGSANVPTNAFDQWLTDAGGWNNAWTSEDDTFYYMSIPSGALDLGLFLESDRMGFLDSGLVIENVENQQDVVLQERSEGYADPHGRDWDAMSRLMYPAGHPYHVPVIGTVADIEGFEVGQVADFWRRHYRPSNALLFVVGNVDPDTTLKRIEHWFSDVPDTGPPGARPAPEPLEAVRRDGMIEDDVEDRTIYMAWPTVPSGHPDAYALEVLSWILDGGRGTRLADKLYYRSNLSSDMGAYAFSSDLSSQFVITATSQRTPLTKLDKVVRKELAKLAKTGPDEAELERARIMIRNGILEVTEDKVERAETLMRCVEQYGQPNCLEQELEAYAAVSAEDIQRVLTTWLTSDRYVTLSVVPKGDMGFIQDALPMELP